jgi:nucleoside-diphosphate-sugar epimerase
MRILITGATGFLGSRLVERLLPTHEIWAVTRRQPPAALRSVRLPEAPVVHWVIQDLAAEVWEAALPSGIDAVIHLAQSPLFRNFPESAAQVYAVAAGATMRLLDWGRRSGAQHFILASTGGLYGSSDRPVREGVKLPQMRSQLGFYFATKRASELLVTQYAGELHTAILRCFFVYGSGQAPQMLIPRLVGNIRACNPVYLHGEDGIRINPIHVDDAAQAIERCLALDESRIFNIAGPEVANLREIAEVIGRRIGRNPVFTVDNTVAPNHLVADIQRMSSALGTPRIGIEAGIAELCGAAEP